MGNEVEVAARNWLKNRRSVAAARGFPNGDRCVRSDVPPVVRILAAWWAPKLPPLRSQEKVLPKLRLRGRAL